MFLALSMNKCPWTIKDVFIVFVYSIALFFVFSFWLTAAYAFINLIGGVGGSFKTLWRSFCGTQGLFVILLFYSALYAALKIKIFAKYNIREIDFFKSTGCLKADILYGIRMYLKFIGLLILISALLILVARMWDMVFLSKALDQVNIFIFGAELEKRTMELKSIGLVGVLIFFVFTPFFEELFFRGCLYRALRVPLPKILAMVMSSFIFSLLHGYFFLFGYIFLVGLILAYMYEERGSLSAPLTFHVLNNLVVFILYTL